MIASAAKNIHRTLGWTKSTFRTFLWAVAALLIVSGCESPKPLPVPPELLGTWHTQDPRYAGLFLKIDEGGFSYSTAEGKVESYLIVKYEKIPAQKQEHVFAHVLHGSRDGQKLQVTLLYESEGGGRLKFKNQNRTFWTRDDNQRR